MISRYSVKKPFTVLVAVILIIVLGVVSVTKMTPDLLPEMSFPYIVLFTSYVGATPEEVEQTVTRPLEQTLAALDDLKEISSSSSENFSVVYLTFEDSVNTDRAMLDIQQVVAKLQSGWPDAVGTPSVLELSTDLIPTVVAAVHYQGKDSIELSSFVNNQLLPILEGTNGVASVTPSGLVVEQIEVELNTDKIDKLNQKLFGSIDDSAQGAFDELEEARQKIVEGREELESAKEELEKGESEISKGKGRAAYEYNQAKKKLDDAKKELTKTINDLEAQRKPLAAQMEEARPQRTLLTAAQQSLNLLESRKNAVLNTISEIENNPDLTEEEKQEALVNPRAELQGIEQGISTIENELNSRGISRDQIPEILAQIDQLEEGLNLLDQGIAKAKAGMAEIEKGYSELEKGKNQANSAIKTAEKKLEEGREQLEAGAAELDEGEKQLDDAFQMAQDQLASTKEAADLHGIVTKELVAQLLQAQNFEMPAGFVSEGDISWIVNVGDKVKGVEALENLALISLGFDDLDVVRLRDVADVHVIDNSGTTYARINGQNGILLSFTKQASYATATVADSITANFRELEQQYPRLRFVSLMDQGDYIYMAISSVVQSLLIGGALAIIILFLFLRDIRPTLAVSISIPVSVLFALVLMYFSGVTMNIISMAGLAIGIGMLVDNSIVVIENIYRLRATGLPAKEAATKGAKEVMGAITASTLTTICVFLPILFVEGLTRQIFMDMILTIAYSLLASLIVALTVIPAISQGLLVREVKPMGKFERKLLLGFEKTVRFAVGHRAIALLLAFALLGGTAYYSLRKGFEYFPESGGMQISVTVRMPKEYSFEESCELADRMINAIEQVPNLSDVGGMINGGIISVIGIAASDENNELTIYALVDENSGQSSIEVSQNVKEALKPFEDEVEYNVAGMSTMSYSSVLSGDGFTMNIYSNDLNDLRTAADKVKERLMTVEGLGEISGGAGETTPALHITVDKEKAIEYNLTTAQVYLAIVEELTNSVSATEVSTNSTSLSATIYSENGSSNRERLEEMTINATLRDGTSESVPLKKIATIEEAETLSAIRRSEQRRYVSVSASIADGYNVTLVSNEARKALAGLDLPAGCQVEYAGQNETIMDAMSDLLWMMLLGILIIYLIMVAQFQSLLSPFIVILTVPLSFAGGFIGLLAAGFEVSIVAMIGMIMLVGIVVNNGIVLVDCANQLRENEGLGKREAVIKATTMRIRPVLMTALTTILGLLPLAIGLGTGAEIIQPVAIVCIGGLSYATLMTVYIVPVLYDLLRRDKKPKTDQNAEQETAQIGEAEPLNA